MSAAAGTRVSPAWIVAAAVFAAPTLVPSGPLSAQDEPAEEPLLEELIRRFQTDPLSLGILLQVVGNYAEGSNAAFRDGFVVGNMRLRLSGELDSGWNYLLQTNFVLSPALLDARIGYRFGSGVRLDAGQFKSPVSYEFLTYGGAIDFVNRSRAVALLAPGRQVGVQVSRQPEWGLGWAVGLFSGPRNLATNDALLVAARLESALALGEGDRLHVGINAGYGQDEGLARALIFEDFHGDGKVAGMDARYTVGRAMLSGEVLYTRIRADDGTPDGHAWGHHLTAGWMWTPNRQVLLRWDRLNSLEGETDDALLFGLNVWPTRATEIQANYVLPVAGPLSRHQALLNLQLGF